MSARLTDSAGEVLLDFQSVLEQFLATERDVLKTYLASARSPSLAVAPAVIPAGSPPFGPSAPADLEPPASPVAVVPIGARPPVAEPASAATGQVAPADSPPVPAGVAEGLPLVRLALRATRCPAPNARAALARDRAIVITDDGGGVADALAERLGQAGYRATIVRAAPDARPADVSAGSLRDVSAGSLRSVVDVEQVVQSIASSCRGIAALVHLLPLGAPPEFERMPPSEWWDRLCHDTLSFFLLAKASRASLQAAAAEGGAAVLAVTAMGGAFGVETAPNERTFFPGQGAVVGLAKSLAAEWPQVRVRAVDVDPEDAPDVVARHIVEELWAGDGPLEVGYSKGQRFKLDLVDAPAALDPSFVIPSDAVILATGGARGITADICLDLASRYQPTFVLVGQTPLPDSIEPPETAALTSPADLKRAMTARLGRDGTNVTVAMVEKAYHHVLRQREVRQNVGALTAAGARVHYVTLDVRNDEAFAALIGEIYATYGRLDGVIHGAGIIEDKLVADKSVDSFERVLETKTRSAFVLSRSVQPESLRFAVFFSSVAGRFGNRGQGDYAAANEVVNKLAVQLGRRWSTRVCSINWAPWDKRGMVSPELKREFMERGVGLIEPSAGTRAFWEEIQQPSTDPAEVVIAAPSGATLRRAGPPAPDRQKTPLLKAATRQPGSAGAARYERLLDPSIDRYLCDHRLDGRPVFPLAFATELMAEAAQATWPDLTVLAVRNLQLLKGIVLDAARVSLTINVRAPVAVVDPLVTVADVEITTPTLAPGQRYRGLVELAPRLAGPPAFRPPDQRLESFPLAVSEAYRSFTFHGPAFQRITSLDGIGANSIVGRVYSPSAHSGLSDATGADWSIDPFVFDGALQMLLMWSRVRNGKTALPSRFHAFRRFGSLSDTPVRCYVQVESLVGGHALRSDVHFVGPDGQVLGILEGMEASCSAALNRMTAS